jgi:hypothetical protein
MFARYPKECILKVKQTPTRVGDSLKKHVTMDKTKPIGFQKVGFDNGQFRVTWFKHVVMSFRTRKC